MPEPTKELPKLPPKMPTHENEVFADGARQTSLSSFHKASTDKTILESGIAATYDSRSERRPVSSSVTCVFVTVSQTPAKNWARLLVHRHERASRSFTEEDRGLRRNPHVISPRIANQGLVLAAWFFSPIFVVHPQPPVRMTSSA